MHPQSNLILTNRKKPRMSLARGVDYMLQKDFVKRIKIGAFYGDCSQLQAPCQGGTKTHA